MTFKQWKKVEDIEWTDSSWERLRSSRTVYPHGPLPLSLLFIQPPPKIAVFHHSTWFRTPGLNTEKRNSGLSFHRQFCPLQLFVSCFLIEEVGLNLFGLPGSRPSVKPKILQPCCALPHSRQNNLVHLRSTHLLGAVQLLIIWSLLKCKQKQDRRCQQELIIDLRECKCAWCAT